MRLFLDTSVLLAASGSSTGASRALFDYRITQGWQLLTSGYAIDETLRNLDKLPLDATGAWIKLRPQLRLVDDIVSLDRPVIFGASKDRPILFTALAWADALITLDKDDFADVLHTPFYGLDVLLPYDFLSRERSAGRL